MKKVSILLSVYNPNKKFLIKQLKSLDNQDYKNIEILIYDDCPNNRCKCDIFKKNLIHTHYKVLPYNDTNLGYVKAFETLVHSVEHDGYIAFCDQDDIWLPNKVSEMVKEIEKNKCQLACCDRMIIDGNDKIITKSVYATEKKKKWTYGHEIAYLTPFMTLYPGMSIICTTKFAQANLPYSPIAFDKWLICCACFEDQIIFINNPLVKYRRHGKNVSGSLNGIDSKKDYYQKRVYDHKNIVERINEKYNNKTKANIKVMNEICNARVSKNALKLFKCYNKYKDYNILKFEAFLAMTPGFIFKIMLKIIK